MHAIALLLSFIAALFAPPSLADTYPSKPIRLVVTFPPGGSTDIAARLVANQLSESLKGPVLVDNRPGGNTVIGTEIVAKAAPDGYTLLFAASAFGIVPSLYAQLPYDVEKDFRPVAMVATFPSVLVTHPSVPANTLQQLIDFARQKPGVLNFGSAGSGSTGRLAGELLKQTAGIDLVHVPYKGGAPAFKDLVGGQIQMMFANITEVAQPIQAGSLKGLVITAALRSELLPEVPTVVEAGYPMLEAVNWQGVFAPAGTPDDVFRLLEREIRRAVAAPDVTSRFQPLGLDPADGGAEALGARLAQERTKWSDVIRTAGITLD